MVDQQNNYQHQPINGGVDIQRMFLSTKVVNSIVLYVGVERPSVPMKAYEPGCDNGNKLFEPTYKIAQAECTYRYLEETYGALNKKQLGIAESICTGLYGASPKGIDHPGYGNRKAYFPLIPCRKFNGAA